MRQTSKTSTTIFLALLLAISGLAATGARAERFDGALQKANGVDGVTPRLLIVAPASVQARAQDAEPKLLIATCRKKC